MMDAIPRCPEGAAAGAQAQCAERKVKVVMDDQQIGKR